jgi:hypothetical protein
VQVSESVELETIHMDGSDPAVVFVHVGLGSLWNPYPQLHAFDMLGRKANLPTFS